MKKIVIIGSSGAGKTTFARTLGPLLRAQVFHLDRLFCHKGWKRKSECARVEILETYVFKEERWIIDGNYISFPALHLETSDTIIFLDLPPLLCLWRLLKRQYYSSIPRIDIPEGCVDKLTLKRIVKVIISPFTDRKLIEQNLDAYTFKSIIKLRSTQEVKAFIDQQICADFD